MKKNLKSIFVLFSIFVGIFMVSCSKTEVVNIPLMADGCQWKVVKMKDSLVVAQEQGPRLWFDTVQSTIGGNAGCNIFNASYVMDSLTANAIAITPLQVTMMACPDLEIEREFLDILPLIASYNLSIEDSVPTLSFMDKDGASLLTLKQAPLSE